MQHLDRTLRNQLEAAINEAREIAEKAARAALEQLGVQEAAPYDFLDEDARKLRRKLRSHGRRLGDILLDKRQTLDNLIEDVAYQHWHRMLFARFLAENDLLMYPDPDDPVAVTLEECEELANDEGASNGWELAARFASQMLPQIFQLDSPIFELSLPPEHQHKLENIVSTIPAETFKASDSLGWVYQFWQSKRKKSVNDAEVKIGAKELPAVTQLFTEPYMVEWLLRTSDLSSLPRLAGASHPLSPPPMREGKGGIKILDPCCGSGHFLVAAFLKLVPLRMAQEGLSARDAVDAVLRENIYGLELDFRCVQIAAFALALAAWQYPDAGGYRPLPELNIACSGLAISAPKDEWTSLAKGSRDLEHVLGTLWEQFKEAPTLGSLIRPEAGLDKRDLFSLKWCQVRPLLKQALAGESDDDKNEMGVAAQGIVKAAELLTMRYDFIVTNVPYLSRNKQGEVLRAYCEKNYPEGKSDLATVFMERCLDLCVTSGTVCAVLPQNWLFLGAYKAYRKKMLENHTFQWIARLGEGGFDSSAAAGAFTVLCTISRGAAPEDHLIHGLDVSAFRAPHEKAAALQTQPVQTVSQKKQLENPDARITLEEGEGKVKLLSEYAEGLVGLQTSDDPLFVINYWEIDYINNMIWEYIQNSPDNIDDLKFYSGQTQLVRWEQGKGLLLSLPSAYPTKGLKALGKFGIALQRMRVILPYIYGKERFHQNVAVLVPHNPDHLAAIWCYCSSPEYNENVRMVDQALKVTNATLVKVPFDLERWQKVAEERYPHGLPKPYSDDPTQWIFHGHPCKSVVWDDEKKWTAFGPLRYDSTVLQVAVARILGYRWPFENGPIPPPPFPVGAGGENGALCDESRQILNSLSIFDKFVDDDGIACIPAVRGEAPLADRLLNLLVAAYGDAWSGDTLSTLLANSDHAGKSLESWLRDKIFVQHCKLFQNRPFIWQIWDGQRDGFSALVNYHTLTHKKLEVLIYTYLGDWIARQRQDIVDGIDGAQERLDAAESLKKKLELILEGEAPYDIFVRWKPLEKQPIGWEPDLNDGVRLNIRPFMTVPPVKKQEPG
ncbi:MAG: N-6 DNA methylase, partial [Proteobacteria bacterium]|nr:N-6 DNA methylase [Pseudomonadota bacterium]